MICVSGGGTEEVVGNIPRKTILQKVSRSACISRGRAKIIKNFCTTQQQQHEFSKKWRRILANKDWHECFRLHFLPTTTKIVAEAGFAHLATCASVCAHQETRNKDETRWPIFDNTSTVGCKKEEQVSNRNSLRRLYSESVLWLMARYVHNIIGCPGWSLLPHKHKSNSKFSKDGGIGQRLLFFLILLRSCFCSWLVLWIKSIWCFYLIMLKINLCYECLSGFLLRTVDYFCCFLRCTSSALDPSRNIGRASS